MGFDASKIETAVRLLLEGIGEDPDREGLEETPRRVAEMYGEIFEGIGAEPQGLLTVVKGAGHDEMVMMRDIPLYSVCIPSKQFLNSPRGVVRASDVRVGQSLWTLNDEGELTTTSVVSAGWRSARSLVEIRVQGRSIRMTPEHPVLTPEGWRPCGSLLAGDKVMSLHPRQLNQTRYRVREGYDLGYALGAVGSDGSIQEGRRISLVVKDLIFADRFATAIRVAFGVHRPVESIISHSGFLDRDIHMHRVRIVSRHVAGLMLHWFGGSKRTTEFRFPRVVMRSREMMQGFLDGYCDGDGYRLPNGSRIIVSANFVFLEELGKRLGMSVRAMRDGIWVLTVPKNWARKGYRGRPGYSSEDVPLIPSDGNWTEVEAIGELKATGTKPYRVYSFECSPHPTFLVGGIQTHNCEHHLTPFVGKAHVAYIPNLDGRITGLSRIARVVDLLAKKPQLQERLTTEIADSMEQALNPRGVLVVIEAEHLCMTMRGVKKPGSVTVTSAVRGLFRTDAKTRGEAMGLISGSR